MCMPTLSAHALDLESSAAFLYGIYRYLALNYAIPLCSLFLKLKVEVLGEKNGVCLAPTFFLRT